MWIVVLTRSKRAKRPSLPFPAEPEPEPGDQIKAGGQFRIVEQVLDGADAPDVEAWFARLTARWTN